MDITNVSGNSPAISSANSTSAIEKNVSEDNSFANTLNTVMSKGNVEGSDVELKKVCKEFEAILLNMMYKEMKATVQKSDLIPSDSGKDIFDSMLDEELTKKASEGSGLGLADVLYKQLSKQLKTINTSNEGDGVIAKEKQDP